jgi:AcrR family transcriptional regulator
LFARVSAEEPRPPSSWTQRKPRESAEVTIQAMLEAGREILQERFRDKTTGGILSLVRAADVAQRSGKTTGAFFYWWPSQEAYCRQLIEYMASTQRIVDFDRTAAAVAEVRQARGHPEPSDAIRTGVASIFEGLEESSLLELVMAVWAAREADDVGILREYYDRIATDVVALFDSESLLENRRIRAPYELEDLVTAMIALVHGLYIRWTVDPEALHENIAPPHAPPPPDGHPARWNLASALCFLLFEAMTERVPANSPVADGPPRASS